MTPRAPGAVLVSGHGADDEALAAARRAVAHRRLVLLSSRPRAPALARLRADEALAGVDVEVRPVEAGDLLACLREAGRALDAHPAARVHVAGGPNLLASALLLAAFERGLDAFFCTPRGLRALPVPLRAPLADLFTAEERRALLALPARGAAAVPDLPPAAKAALLALRRRGLVEADARAARLTETGRYFRAHFAATG